MSVWTDERLATLKRLRKDGKTAAEISRAFHGVFSRNAVIGKLHRLSGDYRNDYLKPEIKAARPQTSRHHRRVDAINPSHIIRKHAKAVHAVRIAKPKPKPPMEVPMPESLGVSLLDLTASMCRWPHGEGPYLFCGNPAATPLLPYCQYHNRLAYVPADRRPRGERFAIKRNFDLPEVVA